MKNILKAIEESIFSTTDALNLNQVKLAPKQRLCKHRCDAGGFKVRDGGKAKNRSLSCFQYNYALFFSLLPLSLCALPKGEELKAGHAHFAREGSHLTIEVSDKAIIDYASFTIEKGEVVTIVQPKSSSTLLSRVTGNEPTDVLGTLSANGRVFLVNPYGVYFGNKAVCDVGALVVSTLDIINDDFLSERYAFFQREDVPLGRIHNEGFLSAPSGSIALLSPNIVNDGTILAEEGRILFASSEKAILDFVGDGLVCFAIESSKIPSRGSLDFEGVRKVLEGVVNADGLIVGTTLTEEGGVVRLSSSSYILGGEVSLKAGAIQIEGSLQSYGDMAIETDSVLCLRDSKDSPLILASRHDCTLESPFIDILALANSETKIATGGNLTFISGNAVSLDAHIIAFGDISLLTYAQEPASFGSLFDPVITSGGSVSFGSYAGPSLKVAATTSIYSNGTIGLTGVDPGACMTCPNDPDCMTLQNSRAIILTAGMTPQTSCNSITNMPLVILGTTFTNSGGGGNFINLSGSISFYTTAILTGYVVIFNNLTFPVASGDGQGFIVNGSFDTSSSGPYSITFDNSSQTNSPIQINGTVGANYSPSGFTIMNSNGPLSVTGSLNAGFVNISNDSTEITGNLNSSGTLSVVCSSDVTVGGNVSAQGALAISSTGSGTISLGGNVTTNNTGSGTISISTGGEILFTTAMSTALVSAIQSGGSVVLAGPVNMSASQNLELNAQSSSVTINGTLGTMGGVAAPNQLSVPNTTSSAVFNNPIRTGAGGVDIVVPVSLGSTITTVMGPVTFSQPITLTGPVNIQTSNAPVSLGTINGANPLTINSGSASTTFTNVVGGTTPPSSLTVTADPINVANPINLGTLNFEGPVILQQSFTISGTGQLTFRDTIDGAFDLTITSSAGVVSLEDVVGGTTPLASLNVISSTGIKIGNNITTTSISKVLSFQGPVTLIGNSVMTPTDGVIFTSTLNGGFNLTINTDNGVTFQGDVGNTSQLGTLSAQGFITLDTSMITVNAKEINFQSTEAGSALTVGAITAGSGGVTLQSAEPILLNGAITTTSSGPISILSAAKLEVPVTLMTANGPVSLSVFDGAQPLNIIAGTAALSFNGNIGSMTPLTSLTVTSSGSIGPTPAVASIASGAVSFTSSGGIALGNINTTAAGTMLVSGSENIQLANFVTMTGSGASISISDMGGSMFTLGLGGTYTADSNFTVNSTSPINITSSTSFKSNTGMISITAPSFDSTGNHNVSMTAMGNVTVSGAIGSISKLAGLTVTGATVTLPSVSVIDVGITVTASSFVANGNLLSENSLINIQAPMVLGNSITLNAGSGTVTLAQGVSSPTSGNSFTIDGTGPVNLTGNITTTNGAITISAPLSLMSSMATLSSSGGAITLSGALSLVGSMPTISSGGGAVNLATIDGAQALTISAGSGAVNFNGNVGGTTQLTSLTVSSSGSIGPNPPVATLLAGVVSLTSSGSITVGSITTSNNMTPLTIAQTMSSSSLNLGGNLNSADGISITSASPMFALASISLTSQFGNLTIQAPSFDSISGSANNTLTLAAPMGAVSFPMMTGIGLMRPFTSFTLTSALQATLPAISTKTGGAIITANMLTLTGNITTQSGPITINEPFDFTNSINLNAGVGTVTLSGDVTGTSPNANFTVGGTGPVLLNGSITTMGGNVTINGPLSLLNATTNINTLGGNITLASVNGASAFSLHSLMGTITLNGAIGNTTPLTSFVANGILINLGNSVTTAGGPITFSGPVVRTNINDVTVNSSPNGMIAFTSTINGDSSGVRSLTLEAGSGMIAFGGNVGVIHSLNAFNVSGGSVLFQAALYNASSAAFTGSSFNFEAGAASEITTTGPVTFSGGSIQLGINTNLLFNVGGNLSFPSLFGTLGQDVGFFVGGTATLGQIGSLNDIHAIALFAGNLFFNGQIHADEAGFNTNGSILNSGAPQTITLATTSIFNSLQGTIGTQASPISVMNPTGIIIAGTPGMLATFTGITEDNTIHIQPNNVPCPLIFNGVVINPCPVPPPPPPPPPAPPPPPPPGPPPPPPVVPPLPARTYYVPGIYSIYNNLASDDYFFPEVVTLRYVFPRRNPLFDTKKTYDEPVPTHVIDRLTEKPNYRVQ